MIALLVEFVGELEHISGTIFDTKGTSLASFPQDMNLSEGYFHSVSIKRLTPEFHTHSSKRAELYWVNPIQATFRGLYY
jgi:hypothetical protein